MQIADCQRKIFESRIKIEERRRKAIVLNCNRDQFVLTQVDGCVIKNRIAADWIVTKHDIGDVVVELKGKDVEHGVKQVYATAKYWTINELRVGAIAGLIVCNQYPRASTQVQRAKQAFAREFRGPLHVVSRNCEYRIEHLFSFKGPHSA
jgi:hypothetical protein